MLRIGESMQSLLGAVMMLAVVAVGLAPFAWPVAASLLAAR